MVVTTHRSIGGLWPTPVEDVFPKLAPRDQLAVSNAYQTQEVTLTHTKLVLPVKTSTHPIRLKPTRSMRFPQTLRNESARDARLRRRQEKLIQLRSENFKWKSTLMIVEKISALLA